MGCAGHSILREERHRELSGSRDSRREQGMRGRAILRVLGESYDKQIEIAQRGTYSYSRRETLTPNASERRVRRWGQQDSADDVARVGRRKAVLLYVGFPGKVL